MKQYIEQNKDRFLEELFSLLRIPSISSESAHKEDMYRCANRLVELLKEAGADKAAVYETTGHPVVYAEKLAYLRRERHDRRHHREDQRKPYDMRPSLDAAHADRVQLPREYTHKRRSGLGEPG